MSFLSSETPFRVQIRPDPTLDSAIVLQFEVLDGMGVLGLRKLGRDEPPPAVHYEESEIEAEFLRAGRFVHILAGGGNRQSYALSRITPDLIRRLPEDAWTELKAVTEYGFRYLVIPEEIATRAAPAAVVQVSAVGSAPAPASASIPPAAVAVAAAAQVPPRPAAAARVGPPSVPPAAHGSPGALPPRQVPMDPALASSALASLSLPEAVEHLRAQMTKVEALHQRVSELERSLEQSRAREQDLLQVLARWQQM